MIIDALYKLKESIFANDIYIFWVAIITLFAYLWCLISAIATKKDLKNEEKVNEVWARRMYKNTNYSCTIFVSLISLFPLLGMFGTVCGLLGLDLATGDMENIKNNFFMALTSTAWGLIFSVLFKLVNAFSEDYIEELIEIAKKLSEETN